MESIISILTSHWTAAGAAVVAIWVLGKFADSSWFQAVRRTWGKACYSAGAALSFAGNTRFGKAWGPLERIFADLFLFGSEQFGAGLRSDNVEKLEEHLDRLTDVGSVTRAEAVAMKLDLLRNPSTVKIPDIQAAALDMKIKADIEREAKEKLKEP